MAFALLVPVEGVEASGNYLTQVVEPVAGENPVMFDSLWGPSGSVSGGCVDQGVEWIRPPLAGAAVEYCAGSGTTSQLGDRCAGGGVCPDSAAWRNGAGAAATQVEGQANVYVSGTVAGDPTWSVVWWMRPDAASSGADISAFDTCTNCPGGAFVDTQDGWGHLVFGVRGSGVAVVPFTTPSSCAAASGCWHQLAVVWSGVGDSGVMDLWIDGAEAGSVSDAAPAWYTAAFRSIAAGGLLALGTDQSTIGRFQGRLWAVSEWDDGVVESGSRLLSMYREGICGVAGCGGSGGSNCSQCIVGPISGQSKPGVPYAVPQVCSTAGWSFNVASDFGSATKYLACVLGDVATAVRNAAAFVANVVIDLVVPSGNGWLAFQTTATDVLTKRVPFVWVVGATLDVQGAMSGCTFDPSQGLTACTAGGGATGIPIAAPGVPGGVVTGDWSVFAFMTQPLPVPGVGNTVSARDVAVGILGWQLVAGVMAEVRALIKNQPVEEVPVG